MSPKDKNIKAKSPKGKVKQIIYCGILDLLAFHSGVSFASSAILVVRLKDEGLSDENTGITDEEASWIASSTMMGCIIGGIVSGFLFHYFGPKRSAFWANLIFFMGFTLNSLGRSVLVICIGRLLNGFAASVARVCIPPLKCEISSAHLRGMTGSLWSMNASLGVLFITLCGSFVSWRYIFLIPLTLVLLGATAMIFMHESPVWLMTKGRRSDAMASLSFYGRTSPTKVAEEIRQIEDGITVKAIDKDSMLEDDHECDVFPKLGLLTRREFAFPFFYLLVNFIALEWSSFPVLTSYMITIFRLTRSPFDPFISSTVVTGFRVLFSMMGGILLMKFKRRPLYISCGATVALSLSCLTVYCYLCRNTSTNSMILESFTWVPLVAVILCYGAFTVGYGNIAFILAGELFPAESKSFGNAIISSLQMATSFVVLKTTPFLIRSLDIHGTFAIFSTVALCMTVFAAVFMPETKDKALHEIQHGLVVTKEKTKKKKKKSSTSLSLENGGDDDREKNNC